MNVSRITAILLAIVWLLLVEFGPAGADELDKKKKALDIINEFAEKICGDVPHQGASSKFEIGGKIKAELSGLTKKLVDLGIGGASKYETSEYSGVLQSDLAKALKNKQDCKSTIAKLLVDRLIPSGKSSQEKKTCKIVDASAGNVHTGSTVKGIPQPPSSGLLEFDSQYKIARSLLLAKNYEKSVTIFANLYQKKPDYPTLALYYGEALTNLDKNEEALAVWLSIPPTEKYSSMNFNRGVLLYRLKRYDEALNYFRLAEKDLRRNDCRFWASRALQIMSEKDKLSSEQFIDRVNEFVQIVDNDVRNLTKYEVKKGTKYEIDRDQVENDVLSRRSPAFYLLWIVSSSLKCEEKRYDESLSFALKAADQLEGPTYGCPIIIDKPKYISSLENLSFLMSHAKERETHLSMLDSTMKKVVKHNNGKAHQEIADFAMLIRSFYSSANTIMSVKKGKFNIEYGAQFTDQDSGVDSIYIVSPKYLAGRKKIDVSGKKQYAFEEDFSISPKTVLDEKPYFSITCTDMAGNSTTGNLFPVIKMIK